MVNPLVSRLRSSRSLEDVDLAGLEQACASTRIVQSRSDLFREGDSGDYLHLILDGWVGRYRVLSDGRRQFVALQLPGEFCDLDRLMLGRVDFGALALTRCTIACLPLHEVRRVIEEHPSIASTLWWMLSAENAVATEWATSLGCRTARERVAHLLCEIVVRVTGAEPSAGAAIPMPLTQHDLADATGLSVVHLNRSLQSLRAEGSIELRSGQLKVIDWAALRRTADFDPHYLQHAKPHGGAATPADAASSDPAPGAANQDAGQLRARLDRREIEIKELNHRIANSLQIASGFLSQGRRHVSDERARATLADAGAQLEAVGKVHRYLYQHGVEGAVDLKRFLEDLAPDITRSTGLGCSVEAQSIPAPGEVAQQLAIVVNELAMNARKHAYPDGEHGELRVECAASEGRLHLTVADRGRGLHEGIEITSARGLGFKIVQSIATQLGGVITANNESGARFTLSVPLPSA